jgi:hypothetical protein
MIRQELIARPAKLYRVGRVGGGEGLWYDGEGRETRLIDTLTDGQAGRLPMAPNPAFRTAGYRWISATDSMSALRNWFSELDLIELIDRGYEVLEILVTGYRDFHFETYSHQVYSEHQAVRVQSIDPTLVHPGAAKRTAA